jgi:Acetoacetate decarboxylase (ADC)
MTDYLVQGQRVAMPVEVRSASACSATFAVPAAAARSVIGYAGLDPVEPLPGRAICSLAFVRYVDSDLGPYDEFAVAFLVRRPDGGLDGRGGRGGRGARSERGGHDRPGGRRGLRGRAGAFIHWLPVNQSFTLEAGRSIWGFPKEMADIDLSLSGPSKRCVVRKDGQLVVDLVIRPGIPVPSGSAKTSFDAYTSQDGVTRRTPWVMRPGGVRSRPGGALLRLGEHPVAEELRRLGLPRTALFTSTIRRMGMTFAEAEPVE